jgi:sigma-54 dependent transcriptional regulator, acetoin dehydrogenase operon transcriptional activator AcoR
MEPGRPPAALGHAAWTKLEGRDPIREDRGLWSERERFQAEGILRGGVRPEIARSWVRSRESGVRPDGDPRTGLAEFDPETRLLRLARPILDRLADEIDNADMSVILTDSHGLVLDRRAGSPSLLRGLDEVLLAPGHVYSEETVGTNGIGTAAEDHGPAWVVGSEHYAEWLRWLSCAGAPVRNPITGRVEGILDLTCRLKDTSPLMVAVVKEGVRQIERRLHEESSERDRELLEHFAAVASRSRRPVVALNDRTVITNAVAARLLEPSDHAVLWNRIAEAIGDGADAVHGFRLSQGSVAEVRFVAFERGAPARGVVLELDLDRRSDSPQRPRHVPRTPDALLPGRSPAWQHLVAAVADLRDTRLPILVTGEPGAGKLAVARCIHEQRKETGPFTVLDAELTVVDGAGRWLEDVRSRLGQPRGSLVLRHLEALDAPTAQALGVLLSPRRTEIAPHVIATLRMGPTGPGGEPSLMDELPIVIHVPPLRERPEDIADILPALLRRHGEAPGPRCSTQVMQVLMRADWPGNVRQMESVIQGVVARRPLGEITLRDLPAEYQSVPRRRLTRMEHAERQAILEVLAMTGGNKVRAAELLGVGRATLYRKLKELAIITNQRET